MSYGEEAMAELHGLSVEEWCGDDVRKSRGVRFPSGTRIADMPVGAALPIAPVLPVTARDYDWARYKEFVDWHARRDDYNPPHGMSQQEFFDWGLVALGLAGEAGEIADHIKKWLYHGAEMDWDKFDLEMGDLFWYWTRALSKRGKTPKDIMAGNVRKLEARYPSGAFSTAESVARLDEATEHLYTYGD